MGDTPFRGWVAGRPSPSPREIGFWGLATLITNAIAPVILEPIAGHYGWTPVFCVGAGAGLIAAALGSLVALSEPAPAGAAVRRTPLTSITGNRGRVFIAAGLTGLGLGTLFTFVVPYALELGAARVRSFFVGYTLAAVAVRVPFGGLADRYGRARVALGALVVYGFAVGAAALLSPHTLPLVGAGLGIAHGLAYPSLNALAVAGEERGTRGAAMAYFFGAYSVGRSAGVAALGFLASSVGYPTTFLTAGGCLLLGAFVLLPVLRSEAHDPVAAT